MIQTHNRAMSELELTYENELGNHRVARTWEQLSDSVMRLTEKEEGYSYTDEEWKVTWERSRDFDIDDEGRLIGDGSNWSGEGMLWEDYATERHETLLRKRFPRDFDGVKDPVVKGGSKALIKEIAAKNA